MAFFAISVWAGYMFAKILFAPIPIALTVYGAVGKKNNISPNKNIENNNIHQLS